MCDKTESLQLIARAYATIVLHATGEDEIRYAELQQQKYELSLAEALERTFALRPNIKHVIDKMLVKIMAEGRVTEEAQAELILANALEAEFDEDSFWESNVYMVMDEVLSAEEANQEAVEDHM